MLSLLPVLGHKYHFADEAFDMFPASIYLVWVMFSVNFWTNRVDDCWDHGSPHQENLKLL